MFAVVILAYCTKSETVVKKEPVFFIYIYFFAQSCPMFFIEPRVPQVFFFFFFKSILPKCDFLRSACTV